MVPFPTTSCAPLALAAAVWLLLALPVKEIFEQSDALRDPEPYRSDAVPAGALMDGQNPAKLPVKDTVVMACACNFGVRDKSKAVVCLPLKPWKPGTGPTNERFLALPLLWNELHATMTNSRLRPRDSTSNFPFIRSSQIGFID